MRFPSPPCAEGCFGNRSKDKTSGSRCYWIYANPRAVSEGTLPVVAHIYRGRPIMINSFPGRYLRPARAGQLGKTQTMKRMMRLTRVPGARILEFLELPKRVST